MQKMRWRDSGYANILAEDGQDGIRRLNETAWTGFVEVASHHPCKRNLRRSDND